ncbi:MAG: CopG family transcriptional regulator [Firmicutes bacterium]|nr:CopG family transcriptional regulator [Bacillota bacterium]
MAIRTQIYLPEELHKNLQERAKATGKSMAEQIRESLVLYFAEVDANTPKPKDPIWQLAGRVESKNHDLSSHHDDYLYPEKGNEA